MIRQSPKHRFRRIICGVLGVFTFYVVTVGLVPAIGRHAEDGRLQGVKSMPEIMEVLETYMLPARYLSKIPPAQMLFELSADFWCVVTNAPETT
jgi:hypothetical protein